MKSLAVKSTSMIFLLSSVIGTANAQESTSTATDTVAAKEVSVLPFQFGIANNPKGYTQAACQLSLGINNFNGFVHGFQGAIIGNSADQIAGTQISYIYNTSKNNIKGFQGTAIANNAGSVEGAQMTGILNRTGDLLGFQGAGIANISTGNITGYQVAGIYNHNRHTATALQAAGIHNTADTLIGAQVGGISNLASQVKGAQISSIANVAQDMHGAQVSGILNKAKKVTGAQVGLINIADSCEGVQIGILNFSKNGYRQVEISSDELFYSSLSFRSGVKAVHGMLSAGIRPDYHNKTIWCYGYGIGTSQNIGKRTMIDVDLSYSQIFIDDDFDAENGLSKLYIGIDQYICKHFSIAMGVTANVLTYKLNDAENVATIEKFIPHTLYDHKFDDSKYNLAGWIGGKIAIRIN